MRIHAGIVFVRLHQPELHGLDNIQMPKALKQCGAKSGENGSNETIMDITHEFGPKFLILLPEAAHMPPVQGKEPDARRFVHESRGLRPMSLDISEGLFVKQVVDDQMRIWIGAHLRIDNIAEFRAHGIFTIKR